MTGGEILILLAIVMLAWIVRAEGKAAERQHEDVLRRIDALQLWLKPDLEAKGRILARLTER